MNRAALKHLLFGFNAFIRFAPADQAVILLLMILQSLTASVGVLLLLPLLQMIGFDTAVGGSAGVTAWFSSAFHALGIPTTLASVLLVYVVIVVIAATIRYQLSVRSSRVQQAYISHLRYSLYHALLHSEWHFILQQRMSDFTHRLSGQVQSVGRAAQLMLTSISQMVIAATMVVLALLLSWQLTLAALGFSGLLVLILLPANRRIHGSGKEQLSNYKTIFQMLTEHLNSLKLIKGFSGEQAYARLLRQESAALEQQQVRLTRLNALTQWLYLVAGVMSFSGLFYLSQTLLVTPVTNTLLLLLIYSRLMPQVSGLMRNYQQLLHIVPAMIDVRELQAQCREHEESDVGSGTAPTLRNALRLEQVAFQYPGKAAPAFQPLSATIDHNSTVALVGPSGAGKSTLADLLSGLMEPTEGTIYCDDTPLTGATRLAWRRSVAYVTQEVFLFHDTVRANLSWVRTDDATEGELWDALEMAAAASFVRALPEGLDTVIGDRGTKLSGGERQRLALARALLTRPQLLILDEATSALDTVNERKILQALANLQGKLTIVLITHRETTFFRVPRTITMA